MLVVLAGFLALTATVDGQDQSGAHISLKSHGFLPSLSPRSLIYCTVYHKYKLYIYDMRFDRVRLLTILTIITQRKLHFFIFYLFSRSLSHLVQRKIYGDDLTLHGD